MEPKHVSLPVRRLEVARESNNELRMRTVGARKKAHRLLTKATPTIRYKNRSTIRLKMWPVSRAACGHFAHIEIANGWLFCKGCHAANNGLLSTKNRWY